MSELRTDFKDEILQEGETHRVYDIKRKGTDEIVESDIYLEKAYTPLQEGNEFGAKEVNEIHGRLNGLAPQNLLINGDFRVNQRGEALYTSTAVKASLTVDCWRIGGQAILNVNDDNIILSATGSGEAHLAQHIDKDLTGKTLSVAVKVLYDKVYTGTITVSDEETVFIDDGQYMTVSAKYDSNRKGTQIYINVKGGHSYSFEYADAFEGSIVYPHVEEDDAIALLRCQDYEIFYETLLLTISYDYNEQKFQAVANFPKMKDIPTFTHGKVEMWANTGNMMQIGVESKEALIDRIRITTVTTPYARKSGACVIFLHDVNLTCEPI